MSARTLARVQGAYYLATGVWPFLSMRTFEAVTGPKTDRWLVITVGSLVGVLGGALLASARRQQPSSDLAGVAAGTAAALAAIDTWYAARGRISTVYLLDAVGEMVLATAWWHVRRSNGETG